MAMVGHSNGPIVLGRRFSKVPDGEHESQYVRELFPNLLESLFTRWLWSSYTSFADDPATNSSFVIVPWSGSVPQMGNFLHGGVVPHALGVSLISNAMLDAPTMVLCFKVGVSTLTPSTLRLLT